VLPSNLTWEALTKPYGVVHPGGRKHPPYTERALELAITRGLDPAGNKLLNVMPRYQMSKDDLAALVSYLRRVGTDLDPGITESSIKIGTVVPNRGSLADMGQAIKAVTAAFFDDVNSQGGIYNRQLELKFTETAETAAATRANVERLIRDEQVFAMTNAFAAGAEKEIFTLMEDREVPLVGPFTLYPRTGYPVNRHIFYLFSGMDEQARALVAFAVSKSKETKPRAAIVQPEGEMPATIKAALVDQFEKVGGASPEAYNYARPHFDAVACVQKLRQSERNAVFFLGTNDEALAFMREAEKLRWAPDLYLPGVVAGKEVFDAPLTFDQKIFLSFPTSPADQTPAGIKEFRAFAEKHKLPTQHLATQIAAYSAAKILLEGLKRAGRNLSREKLIAALEGLNGFETGLTPEITYGLNRRIGSMGAYIVSVNLSKKQFVPVSGWMSAN
jgi:ABC-type branched-subunit amino acid transport system substrate-binding protein